jgi:hypothetical protein
MCIYSCLNQRWPPEWGSRISTGLPETTPENVHYSPLFFITKNKFYIADKLMGFECTIFLSTLLLIHTVSRGENESIERKERND